METFMLTAVKNETHSYVFTTRLNGFILFRATCQQHHKGNHSCFSIAKNISSNAPLFDVRTLTILFVVQNGVCFLWVQTLLGLEI